MTNRLYISTADFNAPFDAANLSGLGCAVDTGRGIFGPGGHGGGIFQTTVSGLGNWPKGRSYWSIASFRAPYANGYFQDNNLMGLDDVKIAMRQVPTWAYAAGGASLLYLAWKKYGKKK